jgi:hypothetical protein
MDLFYLLSLALFSEEPLAVGKPVGLEKETEQHRPVRCDRLVLIAGWPPNELTRPAYPLVILKRTFNDIRLFQCSVLVQRHHSTRIEFEQGRGDTPVSSV